VIVHSVYFWLERDLTAERGAAFVAALKGLAAIPTIRSFQCGTPIPSDRPVVDRTYDWAVVEVFDDQAGLAAYQIHPIHQDFLQRHTKDWARLVVYDLTT
jgi:hypothetical protein